MGRILYFAWNLQTVALPDFIASWKVTVVKTGELCLLIKVLFNSCNHYCFCRFDFLPLLRVYSVVFHFCTEEAETKKPEGSRQVMCFASLHSHPIANPSNISQTPPKNTRGEASEKTSSRDTSQREKSFVGLTWLCCDLLTKPDFLLPSFWPGNPLRNPSTSREFYQKRRISNVRREMPQRRIKCKSWGSKWPWHTSQMCCLYLNRQGHDAPNCQGRQLWSLDGKDSIPIHWPWLFETFFARNSSQHSGLWAKRWSHWHFSGSLI